MKLFKSEDFIWYVKQDSSKVGFTEELASFCNQKINEYPIKLIPEDFKKELEGKRIIWPQAWQEIADVANKLYKEKQCK